MFDRKEEGGMGCRDLNAFNQALLAKQAWRIITKPNSLPGVLKAKYFQKKDFLGSESGPRPSLTWRSIWGTKRVLDEGCRWSIGDGQKVQIWGDKWLPRPRTFKVISVHGGLSNEAKVQEMIDAERDRWKEQLLDNLFWTEDSELIKAIPLAKGRVGDRMVRHYTKSEKFTVRSAYHLIKSTDSFEMNRTEDEGEGVMGSSGC